MQRERPTASALSRALHPRRHENLAREFHESGTDGVARAGVASRLLPCRRPQGRGAGPAATSRCRPRVLATGFPGCSPFIGALLPAPVQRLLKSVLGSTLPHPGSRAGNEGVEGGRGFAWIRGDSSIRHRKCRFIPAHCENRTSPYENHIRHDVRGRGR